VLVNQSRRLCWLCAPDKDMYSGVHSYTKCLLAVWSQYVNIAVVSHWCCGWSGCADEGDSQGGVLQPVEGLHTILRSSWTTHGADIHLPGTDECSLLQVRSQG